MKVHPAIFMKTKERSKGHTPNVENGTGRLEVRTLRNTGVAVILTPGS